MTKRSQIQRKPSILTHLPALNAARLQVTLDALNALAISDAAKQALAASITAAANPQAERPDVVIRTLDEDRRQRITDAQADYARVLRGPVQRGRAALEAMSDEEWTAMLDKAGGA